MRNIKISSRLVMCFSLILLLGLLGNLVGLFYIDTIRHQTTYLIYEHRQENSLLRVYNNILHITNLLERATSRQDMDMLVQCSLELDEFDKNIQEAIDSLSYNKEEIYKHRHIINSFVTMRDTLPEQIHKILDLAQLDDWLAVRLRVKNQIKSFVERIDENVSAIKQEVQAENSDYIEKTRNVENSAIWAIILAALIVLILAGSLSFLVTRSITEPLKALDKGAKSIAKGDFTYSVSIEGQDELRLMANAFNQMTRELAELYENLEQKVKDRTFDLEEKNRQLIDTQQKLIEAEKLNTISQIIVSISHEINNPMTSVLGNVMILKAEKDTISREELGKLLQTIEDQLKRIVGVMAKLRTMERPTKKIYMDGVEMIDIDGSV